MTRCASARLQERNLEQLLKALALEDGPAAELLALRAFNPLASCDNDGAEAPVASKR